MISSREKRLRALECRIESLERELGQRAEISFHPGSHKDDAGWWHPGGAVYGMYSYQVPLREALCGILNRLKATYTPASEGRMKLPEELK